jgi:excisionase family DNA binding protein
MTGFDRLVTTAEAAKQLNVDRSVIVRAVLDGRLACEHKLPGRKRSECKTSRQPGLTIPAGDPTHTSP